MRITYSLIAVWAIMFLLSKSTNITKQLCGKGIVNIGKEYYRYLTASLLHTNFVHLLINATALFWIGYLYERQVGSLEFFFIAIICAISTQFIFSIIYRGSDMSVGGSIYNFALCGFGVVMALFVPAFPKMQLGTWCGNWIVVYLIASNFPVLSFVNASTLVIHGIAFAVGAISAIMCCLLGIR